MIRRPWCFFLILMALAGVGTWLMSRPAGRKDAASQPVADDHPPKFADSIERPPPPDDGFVGSEACQSCHPGVADAYQSHPMARSLTAVKDLVGADSELADHLIEPPGTRQYRVRREGSRLWHHELLSDSNGQTLYDQSVEVTFALGSGARGRAYLWELDGRLFASPLNWYVRAQQWGLAPGYLPESHKRFEREVGPTCLMCHAGRLNEDASQLHHPPSPFFLESTIGCERCHGPGRRHIEFQTRTEVREAASEPADPIINPTKLDAAQREDVCNQCHLQGESQHLRYGRQVMDFRPGMRLEDVWLIFLARDHDSSLRRTEAVSQVEQMRSSVCYSKSQGRLGCLSCHDSHSIPTPAERVTFYRQRCETCHQESSQTCQLSESQRLQAPEGNSCIACHMPSLGTSNVPHTAQTDHRILRRPDRASTQLPPSRPSTDLVLFDGAEQRIPQWETQRARGLMLAGLAEKVRDRGLAEKAESLLEATLKVAPDDVATVEALGLAKLLLGKLPDAQKLWESGLALQPEHESLLVRLAFFSHDRRDLRAAAAYFDRLFSVNPSHAAFHGRQAHILGQLGDFDRAIQEAHRAIELNPTLSQAHEWLAEVYRMRQESNASQFHQDRARRLREAGF